MKIIERIAGKWQVLFLALAIAGTVSAQQPRGQQGPPPIPEGKEIVKMVEALDKEIEMTDAQEAKVLKLYQEHFAEVKKLVSKGRPDRSVMESKKKEFEAGVKQLLTKDQQKAFEAYQKKNMSQGPQERPQRR